MYTYRHGGWQMYNYICMYNGLGIKSRNGHWWWKGRASTVRMPLCVPEKILQCCQQCKGPFRHSNKKKEVL